MEDAALENVGENYGKRWTAKRTKPKKQRSQICCVTCFVIAVAENRKTIWPTESAGTPFWIDLARASRCHIFFADALWIKSYV